MLYLHTAERLGRLPDDSRYLFKLVKERAVHHGDWTLSTRILSGLTRVRRPTFINDESVCLLPAFERDVVALDRLGKLLDWISAQSYTSPRVDCRSSNVSGTLASEKSRRLTLRPSQYWQSLQGSNVGQDLLGAHLPAHRAEDILAISCLQTRGGPCETPLLFA